MKVFESYNGPGLPNFLVVMTDVEQDGDNSFVTVISQNTSLENHSPQEQNFTIRTSNIEALGNFEKIVVENIKLSQREHLANYCLEKGITGVEHKFEEVQKEKIVALSMYGAFDFLLQYRSNFHHGHLQHIIAALTRHPAIY